MATFTRQLPALLAQTHVVLEVRDIRLPLTSINPTLESALQKWKKGREASGGGVCERIVVYSKRDLISGGEEVRFKSSQVLEGRVSSALRPTGPPEFALKAL